MRTVRLTACLILSCLMLTMTLSQALAAATLNENGEVQAPISDVREIVADNAALVSEIDATREALASERKSTEELIDELNRYMAASDEEKQLLRDQNSTLKKQVKAERARAVSKMLLGLLIGAIAVR